MVISFGLEGNILEISKEEFSRITARDIRGAHKDGELSEIMRSFVLPTEFNHPQSRSPNKARTINIFFALVTECSVWIVTDFARLVSFHLISRERPWSQYDLLPSSEVMSTF